MTTFEKFTVGVIVAAILWFLSPAIGFLVEMAMQ